MAHFYLTDASHSEAWAAGSRVELAGGEAKHAVSVSRVRVGERLLIGDGAGRIASGSVLVADAARLVLEVDSVRHEPLRSPRILLAQALAKGDRDELAVQASTELGVDGILPWAAARSVSRWEGAKMAKGRDRWSSIVREATKQSVRAWLPQVGELHSTKQLAARAADSRMLVLDPTAERRLAELTPSDLGAPDRPPGSGPADILLVVGPEGGIAPNELELFRSAGAIPVRLGPEVLRTSTAGPAAIAVLNAALGRW